MTIYVAAIKVFQKPKATTILSKLQLTNKCFYIEAFVLKIVEALPYLCYMHVASMLIKHLALY